MMNQVKKVHVLLSSPNDVLSERKEARETILHTINVWAKFANIEFVPIDCEHNTFPSSGKYTQGVLNDQFGDRHDVLVAIFWHRLGTQTPSYPSGTVEEIERAYLRKESGDDVLIAVYFKTKNPPEGSSDKFQHQELMKFKSDLAERGNYYWKFKKRSELTVLLIRHLGLYVENKYFLTKDINAKTKEYLTQKPKTELTTVEYMNLYFDSSKVHTQLLNKSRNLISQNTANTNNDTGELRRLLDLPKSKKVAEAARRIIERGIRNDTIYSKELNEVILELKEAFIKSFDRYSAAILTASKAGRRERKMMRQITKELPELKAVYEKLVVAIDECHQASNRMADNNKTTKIGSPQKKLVETYGLYIETVQDFVRILDETYITSKKLLRRRLW